MAQYFLLSKAAKRLGLIEVFRMKDEEIDGAYFGGHVKPAKRAFSINSLACENTERSV